MSGWLWPRLAVCQLALFVLIETVERLVAGDPLSANLYHEIVEHGALFQIVVALLVTELCWCLALTLDMASTELGWPAELPIAGPICAVLYQQPHCHRCTCRWCGARAPPLPC